MNEIKTFDHTYTSLIDRLNKGERAHLELDLNLLNEIEQRWQNALVNNHVADLNAVLCILDHARHPIAQFENLFFLTLESNFPTEQKVFALGASWKHLLDRWSRAGDRVPMRYLEILRSMLTQDDLELREWALRTIDQVGPQGRMLSKEVFAAKAGWKSLVNPHAKAISQLVGMFEKRWNTNER